MRQHVVRLTVVAILGFSCAGPEKTPDPGPGDKTPTGPDRSGVGGAPRVGGSGGGAGGTAASVGPVTDSPDAGVGVDAARPPGGPADALPATTAAVDARMTLGRFAPLTPNTTPLRFGADVTGKRLLVGDIDRARIWNRAVTAAEVASMFKHMYAACDVANGCIGDWTFDQAADGVYQSAGPVVLPAKLVGPGQAAVGQEGGAVHLQGGYIEVQDNPALALAGPMSVAIWVRQSVDCPKELGGCSNMTLVDKGTWLHLETVAGHPYISSRIADPGKFDSAQVTFSTGSWRMVVYTFEPTAINFYVDGKLNRRPHIPDGTIFDIKPNTSPLVFGNRSSSPQEGAIDQVRFYNRALSAAEIMAEASQQYLPCTTAAGCAVEWTFDDAATGPVQSAAGARLSGTRSGTVEVVEGVTGKAVRLTGGQIDVPADPALGFDGSVSFSAWVKRDPVCPATRTDKCYLERIFTKGGGLMLSFREDTGWEFIASGNIMLFGAPAPRRGEWAHIAITVDRKDGARLYNGGKLVRGWIPGVTDNLCYACSGNAR
jgi:hypothetical protein